MVETIKYLKGIFGETMKYNQETEFKLPTYLKELFTFCIIDIDQNQYILVKELKKQRLHLEQLKKQLRQINIYTKRIPVFVFDGLRLSQRNTFVQNHIPFIQPDYHIYLPNVMIHLSQKEKIEKVYHESFSIAAQVIYIYLLLNRVAETNAPRLSKEIPYSKITISRALAELVSRNLLYTEGNATRKIYKVKSYEELWEQGKQYLFQPVEKRFYVRIDKMNQDFLYSNETALSMMETSINEPQISYYASTSDLIKKIDKSWLLNPYDMIVEPYSIIEQFKYNPKYLSSSHHVDVISLYAQLKDHKDERIQLALDELMEENND